MSPEGQDARREPGRSTVRFRPVPFRFVRAHYVWPLLLAAALPVVADPATGVARNTMQSTGQSSGQNSGQSSGQNSGQGTPAPAKPALVPAPPRLVFTLSAGLSYDDNPDLTSPASGAGGQAELGLQVVFNHATRVSNLNLSLNGLVTTGNGLVGANTGGLPQPSANLAYVLDTGNTKLNLDLGIERSPVNAFTPTTLPDGTLSSTDLVAATGTVLYQHADLLFHTGIERPLSFDLAGYYAGRLYSDTTSTGLYNNNFRSVAAGLHWRIDGVSTLSLTANASGTDYANTTQTQQRAQDLSLGYDRLLRQDLTLRASLGHSTASATENDITTDNSSGVVGSLDLVQKRADGTASVTLASTLDALGPRNALSFGRSLILPVSNFNVTAGVSARPGETGQLVGSLDYLRTLPADTLDLNLSRQIGLNSDNLDQASNVLGLNWQHQVNAVSSVGLSLSLASTTGVNGNAVESASRQTLGATWSHDLTQDWQFNAGYQYNAYDSANADKITSNSVFLTVSRKMILQP